MNSKVIRGEKQNDALAGTLMVLLNASVFLMVGVILWAVLRIFENSQAFTAIIKGNFLP